MRLKVDEDLPREVAEILKNAGHDASSVHDQSLAGAEDQTHAVVCQHEQRGLISLDVGFTDIRTYSPRDYSGMVVLRLSRQDKIRVQARVRRLLPLLE